MADPRGNYFGIKPSDVICVGEGLSGPPGVGTPLYPTWSNYPKCSDPGRNYSILKELNLSTVRPSTSLSFLAGTASQMLANPSGTGVSIGPTNIGMSSFWNKRGISMGFNFSVGFTGTSYSKYGVDLCTGGASTTASSNPYRPSSFLLNVNGSTGTNSASQGSRCAGAGTAWSVTDQGTNCSFTGSGPTSWTYGNASYWPA